MSDINLATPGPKKRILSNASDSNNDILSGKVKSARLLSNLSARDNIFG